ncbi:Putative uncharacterized protein [Moritella viscosa]|uniref:hypothetical protein n=1 Tax=Moritella viscosa TaxID=80854 RepID=UPI00050900E2|nr:hypothetical protein [Moritella viscosa]CED61901.1 putative uncharacterized protein [Moritella viscosa]SHO07460.1 Putative uncharacterized protein [Moritella viscosa]SHO21914.1 Putative uncharacterized protein [Moritella viscosa]
MSRKTNNTNKTTDVKAEDNNVISTTVAVGDTNVDNISVELTNEQVSDVPADSPTDKVVEDKPANDKQAESEKHDHFSNIVLSGKGKKLSPKTTNHVFFDIAEHDEEGELYIRLSGNEGGGLFSQEWINLSKLFAILDEQVDKPFKSAALKAAFRGLSSNNNAFICASLRSPDMGLIVQSGTSVFLHVLADDYEEKKAKLLALT